MRLAVLIGGIFASTLQIGFPAVVAPLSSNLRYSSHDFQPTQAATPKASFKLAHGCHPLKSGQTIQAAIPSMRSTCFSVKVQPEEATQLVLDQPEDLEIRIHDEKAETRIDGFEFGNETVTMHSAGLYRVEVRKSSRSPGSLTFSMSRRPLALQQAVAWQEAEFWATASKLPKKIEDINKSLQLINKSLQLWSDLGDTASIARTYLKQAELALRSGNPASAQAAAEKALGLCRASSDARCAAEAASNSGSASSRLGDVEEASRRLQEALKYWRELANVPEEEARNLSNLGLLLWHSGDIQEAISFSDQARLRQRGKDIPGYGTDLNNLGLCYQSLAEYEKARGYFEGALAAFARSKSSENLIRVKLNLGRNYMLEGHLRRARSLLNRTLGEAARLTDPRAKADTLRNLGQTLWREGNLSQAQSSFEEALKIDRGDGDRRGQSSALHYLGLISQKAGDIPASRSLLMQATQLRREIGLRDDAAESLFALASLEYGEGKLDAAHDLAEQALKLLELVRSRIPGPALRASFYSRKRQFFDLLVEIAMSPRTNDSEADGLLAVERGRGRSLMDLLAAGALLRPPPQDLAQKRRSIQRQLDYLSDRLSSFSKPDPDKDANLRQRVHQLVAEDEDVEARIREFTAGENLGQTLTSINELRQHLPADAALLEYHLGAQHSYMWLVESQQIRAFPLPPARTIEAEAAPAIQWFGQILERRRSPARQAAFDGSMRKLSATLLGGLSGIRLPQRLILVPDGVLHRIPFAALWLPDASTRLGLAYDLVQIPSAAYLTVGKHPRPVSQFPQAVLAIVDPVFSGNDPRVPRGHRRSSPSDTGLDPVRLPFTSEVSVIESLVPQSRRKTLRGFDASREMLAKLPLADFGVLHFSTHAFIDDQIPESSTVVLSKVNRAGQPVDGSLRPYQWAQLRLNGSIVVLSACDTALGKQVLGEGLVGLTSSLFSAGGSQLVLTIAKVDAEASSYFLGEVYRRFLPGSAGMEHSITLTRQAMARSRQFSDPYYWASFIVIGRPTDTAGPAKSGLGPAYNSE